MSKSVPEMLSSVTHNKHGTGRVIQIRRESNGAQVMVQFDKGERMTFTWKIAQKDFS